MRKTRAVVILTLLAMSAFSVILTNTKVSNSKTTDITKILSACDISEDKVKCVEETWLNSFNENRMSAFYQALDSYSKKSPEFTVYCHDAGHKAGRKAETQGVDVVDVIKRYSTESGACNNGFLHGSLDSFAYRGSKNKDFTLIIKECEESRGKIRDACNDGVGHSAWVSSFDYREVTEICMLFKEEYDIRACLAGGIMQALRPHPITNEEPTLTYKESYTEIPKMCEIARVLGAPDGAVAMCYSQLSIPILEEVREYTNIILNGSRGEYKLKKGALLWSQALDKCGDVGKYAEYCSEQVAAAVTWYVGDDPTLREILCSEMSEPWKTRCNEFRTR
ncbi:MAG: hypothetical protein ACKOW9_04810 [Candidatus Paceibacterota bacterium]